MITEEQEKVATRILNVLETARFAFWYADGRFNDYLSSFEGNGNQMTKAEVLSDISTLFNIQPNGKIE